MSVDDSEPEAFAGWLLLKGRHQVVAGDLKGGLATLDQALKLLKGDVPVAREKALPRLVFWLVESGRPAVAMTLATRAMAAGVIRPAVLAAASRLAADKGFDRPAAAMFKLGLSSPDEPVRLACYRGRFTASRRPASRRPGPFPAWGLKGWGYDEIMIKGRLLFRSKQYAQAIEQFSRGRGAAPIRASPCSTGHRPLSTGTRRRARRISGHACALGLPRPRFLAALHSRCSTRDGTLNPKGLQPSPEHGAGNSDN